MLVLYYGGFSGISLNWKQCVGPAFIQSPPFLPSAASRIYKVQCTNLAGLVLHYFSPSGESSDSYIFESKKKNQKLKSQRSHVFMKLELNIDLLLIKMYSLVLIETSFCHRMWNSRGATASST